MQRRSLGRYLAALVGLAVMLACGPSALATETPAPTATPSDPAETPTPSPPPASPTPSPEPTTTPSPTPTPGPEFDEASIYAVSHLEEGDLLVTLQMPDADEAGSGFEANVADSRLTCRVLAEYTNRLYCSGPEPFENYAPREATFELYGPDSTSPVFQTSFVIPAQATATPTLVPTTEGGDDFELPPELLTPFIDLTPEFDLDT